MVRSFHMIIERRGSCFVCRTKNRVCIFVVCNSLVRCVTREKNVLNSVADRSLHCEHSLCCYYFFEVLGWIIIGDNSTVCDSLSLNICYEVTTCSLWSYIFDNEFRQGSVGNDMIAISDCLFWLLLSMSISSLL